MTKNEALNWENKHGYIALKGGLGVGCDACQGCVEAINVLARFLREAEARLAIAIEGLRWYADPVAYSIPVKDMDHHVFSDRGAKARAALDRAEEDEKI